MNESCPFEASVADAARSGEWSPELEAHRNGCLTCAEVTLVAVALAADSWSSHRRTKADRSQLR